ncbi:hypothetical protein HYQ44_012772 [Verticillium longisporum]|nr:hypothetical protein HYQ44_012772 [Verticillium longisporum]
MGRVLKNLDKIYPPWDLRTRACIVLFSRAHHSLAFDPSAPVRQSSLLPSKSAASRAKSYRETLISRRLIVCVQAFLYLRTT